jgi:acyl-CoA reductase-like NAD-dependent aldehyde dehydrogenase
MLIDGALVEGATGAFVNTNPATETVVGEVTDASPADVHRAVDAARRAFDETSWSSDRAFRQQCLLQLQAALEREKEQLREELILEVGCPRMVTHGPQLDAPLSDALRYPAQLIDEYPWQVDLGDAMVELTGQMTSRRVWREPVGVVAAIVLDDADLEGASLIGMGVCMHAGQGCATPTRMLLPRSRYEEGVEFLAALFGSVTVGDPQLPETLCGPVITAAQRDRILRYIRTGIEEGATALAGGDQPPEGVDAGYFVSPTLFVDVDNSMTIAREEIFGPVLTVIPYEDDDDAVRIANDNDYGLAGYVLSESLERSLGVARRLRAGSIGLNGTAAYGAEVPVGGYKASGVGRQNGIAGFEQYLEVKSVAFPAS